MNKLIKIAGVATLSGLLLMGLSGTASAGGDRHYGGGYDSSYPHRGHSYRYDRHYDRHTARSYRRHKKHHHGNNDDDLLIGLLVGGIFGYAISNTQRQNVPQYDYYPPSTTLPPPRQEPYPATGYNDAYRHDTCLQEREYQTTVTVGGKQVPAYGTACLQPDGSWRRGPAQMVSY